MRIFYMTRGETVIAVEVGKIKGQDRPQTYRGVVIFVLDKG